MVKLGVMQMMKILAILGMFLTVPAFATTMCAENDTIAVVLDPFVSGTNNSSNADLFEWSATFPYGTVWGIATCVDVAGTGSTAVDELRDSNGELATGGERTGKYCWCQMTHPAVSRWVFQGANSSVADCRSLCANGCGSSVRSAGFRGGVFGSLGH